MDKKRQQRAKKTFYSRAVQSSRYKVSRTSSSVGPISEEEIASRVKKLGAASQHLFESSFQQLRQQIVKFDPVLLLSFFAYHGLATEGSRYRTLDQQQILHHHIELLQAIALQCERAAFANKFVLPSDFKMLSQLIQSASTAFYMSHVNKIDLATSSEQEQRRFDDLQGIRFYTQVVRNWGYPQQVTRIITGLFAPIDDELEKQIGVRIAHLVAMCMKLAVLARNRMKRHLHLLRKVVKAESISSAINSYLRYFPDIALKREELLQLAKESDADFDQWREKLADLSNRRLPTFYTFTLADFVEAYPVPIQEDRLRPILERWAYSFGELGKQNLEYFIWNNPIWEKPLVRLDDDVFFWPVIETFFSFGVELMKSLLEPEPKPGTLHEEYLYERGKYLERQVKQLFQLAFPSAKVYSRNKEQKGQWKDYENDLLVLIDSYLIIVEAKSHKVTPPARRGAKDRLEKSIKQLMIDPSQQSKRFADYLQKNPGIHRFYTEQGAVNVDTSNVREIVRLNVILESLGDLHSRWPRLLQSGLIKKEKNIEVSPGLTLPPSEVLAPTISLMDLELVFDLLKGTCEKLHYLVRRAQLEVSTVYEADEEDLLAFYLETGFDIGGKKALNLTGWSDKLGPYFLREWSGENVQKPRRRLTRYWKNILRLVEREANPRWTEVGCILLNVSNEDQAKFKRAFRKVQETVRREGSTSYSEKAVLLNRPLRWRDAIVGLAYKGYDQTQLNRRIEDVGTDAAEQTLTNRVVVITVDVEHPINPFNTIACFAR